MNNLDLFYIDDSYIDYLRNYDEIVPYNKIETRPYIGVVYIYKGFTYFAPLSSPKPKHLKMNPKALDIFKIKDGELGIVNLNNMIPAPKECLTEVLNTVTDEQYKTLLTNQIHYLNNKKANLLKKVSRFQELYRTEKLPQRIKQRCCNFELLEKKCNEYIVTLQNKKIDNPIQEYCNNIGLDIIDNEKNEILER